MDTSVNKPDRKIQEDEISLKELILKLVEWYRYVCSKWIILIAIGILGAAIGLAYSYIKKPVFKATTTFVLETGESGGAGLGQYAGLASMVGIDLGGGSGGIFQGENIIELYKSRKMIEQTLFCPLREDTSLLLVDRYLNFKGYRKEWKKNSDLRNIDFKSTINDSNLSARVIRLKDSLVSVIVEDIKQNYLSVSKPDKKLSIINVELKSPDEKFSKNFNDQLVKNVNDFYVQTKTKKSLHNISILQHQVDSVKGVVYGAINSVASVADATPNLNPVRQILRAPAQRYQLNAEANKAILSELVKNLEFSKMNLRQETPLIQLIDIPVYPLENDKLPKLKVLVIGFFVGVIVAALALVFRFVFKNVLLNERL